MNGRLQMALMLHSSRQSVAYERHARRAEGSERVVSARARIQQGWQGRSGWHHDAVEHDRTIGMASILAQVWKSPTRAGMGVG